MGCQSPVVLSSFFGPWFLCLESVVGSKAGPNVNGSTLPRLLHMTSYVYGVKAVTLRVKVCVEVIVILPLKNL